MPFRKLAAVLLWLGVALAARLPAVGALPPPSSSCQRKCGDVDIPYPFGIGIEAESPDHCAMPGFFLRCNGTAGNNASKPFYGNVEVLDISLQHGQARVMNQISSYCYNTKSLTMDPASTWQLNLTGTPYRLSNTANRFTVIGCRTLAYIRDEDNVGKYMSGCVAMCRRGDVTSLTNGSCSGIGCCQTAIPSGLQYYQVTFNSGFNTREIYNVSRCSYAVLMDSSNFTFLTSYVTSPEFNNTNGGGRAPLVLDWAIGNETCEAARNKPESYACVSNNSECFNSPNGPGYICNCSKGFRGNPYLQDPEHGCRDIDECTELAEYPCSVAGTCHNIAGGFKCSCPRGYPKGNAQNGTCERDQTLQLREKLAIGAFACVLVGLTAFLGSEVLRHKRSTKRQALLRQSDEYFQQHGGQLLSEMMKVEGNIAFTLYDRGQIESATNSFDKANIVGEGGQGTVYKAILDNNAVAIKRCKEVDESRRMDFVQELVILCRVNHPNVVKLLGCCLQFEAPMLVYEFVQNKTLQELLHHQRNKRCRVTLGTRLRIAAESAEALAHLHSLPHPILHGDVKPANILLGEGWVAKVSDFGCSTIDEKTQAVPKGTPGYLDPDYLLEYQLTDKNDVYSFGVVLLELLTGKKPLSKDRKSLTLMFQESMGDGTLHELLDSDIVDEASMGVIRQVAVLASQCLVIPGTRRPAMRRVAEELRRLADQVHQHPQPPLVLEALSLAEMGSSTSSGYTESETTGSYSLEKKAALSIEFAR